MELKHGYKQAEVGVIPEEWSIETLGSIFDFSGGFSASRDQLTSDGYCYLHYGDIHKSSKTFINVQAEYLDIPKLNVSLKRVSPKSLLNDGDIVFVDASEDDEGTSKHVVVINDKGIPYISGLHTIVAKSKTTTLHNAYKRCCFQSSDIKRQFYFYAVGTKVSGISKTNIAKIFLPIPFLPEQRAIAAVLGDVDALINGVEQLIAKKRDLKQAAMQQLLTSQQRLPGFSGEWEVKKVSILGRVITGGTPPTQIKEHWGGDIPWVTPTDISGERDIFVTERQLTTSGLAAIRPLLPNSVLVTCIASIGKNAILRHKGGCNQQINAVVPYGENNAEFLYYLFESAKQYLLGNAGMTATSILSKRDFSDLQFCLPRLPEQTAIARVLSDMDAEIAALEARLAKTRALKQGMMQELLTGRVRLV